MQIPLINSMNRKTDGKFKEYNSQMKGTLFEILYNNVTLLSKFKS